MIIEQGSQGAAGASGSPSDINLKEEIYTISDALRKIHNLRGVSFIWKKDKKIVLVL